VTAPPPTGESRFDALLAARDSSLPLAAAALVQVADERGQAPFGALAVAYREEFLQVRARVRGTALQDSGSLSVDDARANLRDSVLPRLALEHAVSLPAEWRDDAPVAVTPELWPVLAADRPGMVARLLAAAAATLERAETVGATATEAVRRGSRIESAGLVKAYKGRRVVDDVSIELQQGEIVGLLGPNGAGKTTTFYMFTGLIRPEAGAIHLDGQDITSEPMYRRARAGLGYLAQEPSIFRKLTVEQNVLAILETLPIDAAQRAERLERLLDELGVKHLRRQKAYQLSGGERRRLEITRALVTEPKFLLLDEPFAGVDPIAVHDIQTIVAGLRRRGIGVLITDHNVEQTLDIVDRAYIMFEGRVQVSGTVRELVFDDQVAHRYLGPTLTARLRARLGEAA
jgi:lipopolysaccharide export system ATP-binding protein